ncbi:hypothetical protein F9L16_24015 [Agarivorans sp. B2Z047]|uniref:hypothetical protein n=1 Tax=Agarivorans sp. B2Z047 TaxID=2652721 RepID=UPI00128CE217|nr:hypothetical protein [Agarivorans sp. B2Z047]MPW32014.1 hypothetical protein [Agarivorans sp. B2Z047]UQN41914.1 hypothetical protein LQZ07_19360 [Agarivorans sp. B2Z047]UQN44853.1 hypothetical protein LQZ07_10430 [Agarivorans sp. B2Z047]
MADIITIEGGIEIPQSDVISVFSDTAKLQPYIDRVRDEVSTEKIDLTTDKSRKAIGSRAHKVSKIKTALTKIGKDSVADLKKQVLEVNAGVKYAEEKLSQLRDETRKPLTDWEKEKERLEEIEHQKEEARIQAIQDEINNIRNFAVLAGNESIEHIAGLIEALDTIDPSEGFDEFTQDALVAIAETKGELAQAMQAKITERQQAEQQAQLQKEREENEKLRRELAELKANAAASKAPPEATINQTESRADLQATQQNVDNLQRQIDQDKQCLAHADGQAYHQGKKELDENQARLDRMKSTLPKLNILAGKKPPAVINQASVTVEFTEYQKGYIDALEQYAHWKDGVMYVGTGGKTLTEAVSEFIASNKTVA